MEYYVGIDVGTGGARTGIFDRNGKALVFCAEPIELSIPRPGWAEQDPEEWWSALCTSCRRAMEQSGVSPEDIRGLSIDTTCCTVLFSGDDMVPLRPAILWMDMRAAEEAKFIGDSGHDALKYNGYGPVSAECLPAKALWIKKNEPELYRKATRVYECTDWIMYRLTGRYTASLNCASCRWYYNSREGGYPRDFYERIGLEDLTDRLPPEVLPMGAFAGGLREDSAREMGLRPGIPVGEGGADAFVGVIGLNAVDDGKMALITGSSHLHVALIDREMHSKGMWGTYPDAIIHGKFMLEGGQTSTGSIVNWIKNQLCGYYAKQAEAEGIGVYDILNREAEKLPVGAEGLVALDFFQGNRTPHVDPNVRGMIYGLSLIHTPAHIYRAIVESICFGTKAILDVFESAGFTPNGIVISGGVVKSRFWLQAHADVCDVPIIVPRETEAPCLGSAILGAVAAGAYPDIVSAAAAMTGIDSVVEPDHERHEAYMFYYRKYREFYELAKDWMHEVTEQSRK